MFFDNNFLCSTRLGLISTYDQVCGILYRVHEFRNQYRGVTALILDENVEKSQKSVFFDHNFLGMGRLGLVSTYDQVFVKTNNIYKNHDQYRPIQRSILQKKV